MAQSFNFFASYADAFEVLPKDAKCDLLQILIDFVFKNKEPETPKDPMVNLAWILISPTLRGTVKRANAASRPTEKPQKPAAKKSAARKTKSIPEPEPEPELSASDDEDEADYAAPESEVELDTFYEEEDEEQDDVASYCEDDAERLCSSSERNAETLCSSNERDAEASCSSNERNAKTSRSSIAKNAKTSCLSKNQNAKTSCLSYKDKDKEEDKEEEVEEEENLDSQENKYIRKEGRKKQVVLKKPSASSSANRKRFQPPTPQEVRAYCDEKGFTFDPDMFVSFYESKGWLVGRTPMTSWKAACRTWQHNRDQSPQIVQTPQAPIQSTNTLISKCYDTNTRFGNARMGKAARDAEFADYAKRLLNGSRTEQALPFK